MENKFKRFGITGITITNFGLLGYVRTSVVARFLQLSNKANGCAIYVDGFTFVDFEVYRVAVVYGCK